MIHNKKGDEQPRAIVYVIFCVVLAITGMYVAFSFKGDSKMDVQMFDYKMDYNIMVSQLVNTEKCFAYSGTYTTPDGKTKNQVQPGILDDTKMGNGLVSVNMDSCKKLKVDKTIYVMFYPLFNKGVNPDYALKIRGVSMVPVTVNDATVARDKWNAELASRSYDFRQRQYYVLIKKGDEMLPAIMEVAMEL